MSITTHENIESASAKTPSTSRENERATLLLLPLCCAKVAKSCYVKFLWNLVQCGDVLKTSEKEGGISFSPTPMTTTPAPAPFRDGAIVGTGAAEGTGILLVSC